MMNLSRPKLSINKLILIYTLFSFMIVCSDTIYYFCNADYIISIISSAVILGGVYFLINKYYVIEKQAIDAVDIVALSGIAFFFLFRVSIPDIQWDTQNYHVYSQINFGKSNIDFDFFPARTFNTLTLPLGDRMFNVFRYLLGYRLGTILNLLVRLLVYLQLKNILSTYFERKNINFNKWLYLLMIIPIMLFDDSLLYANTYYIEMLSVPIFIEIIRIILFSEKQTGLDIALVIAMAALTFSIKISNGYIILALAIPYFIKFRKSLSFKPVAIGLILSVFTVFVYFYINYKDTLNPVYPYMNDLFQSPYFITGVDINDYVSFNSRFGPETLKQYILWPLYVFLAPDRGSDLSFNSGRLIVSLITLLVYVILKIRKNKNRLLDATAVLFVVFYIIYLFPMQGYSRYMPVLDIIGGIFTVLTITECFISKKNWQSILAVITCMFLGIQVSIITSCCIPKRSDYEAVKLNSPYLFIDRESGISKEITDQIDFFVILNHNASNAAIIKDSVPIIMPYDLSCLGFGYDMPAALKDKYDQIVESLKGKRGFVPVQYYETEGLEDKIKAAGMTLIQIIPVNSYFYAKPVDYFLYEVAFN